MPVGMSPKPDGTSPGSVPSCTMWLNPSTNTTCGARLRVRNTTVQDSPVAQR